MRHFVYILLVTLIVCIWLGCNSDNKDASASSKVAMVEEQNESDSEASQKEDDSFVEITTREQRTFRIDVELAITENERTVGLMHRKHLPKNTGMLFVMERVANHNFWMQNTLIPLDMLFINEEGRIVGIIESATPGTTTLRGVGRPSRYVLELNGGFTQDHGILPGDTVEVEKYKKWFAKAAR
jgi:uncharacterized membrane protein (UPF0127 family)